MPWSLVVRPSASWHLVSRLFHPYNGLQQCLDLVHSLPQFKTCYHISL